MKKIAKAGLPKLNLLCEAVTQQWSERSTGRRNLGWECAECPRSSCRLGCSGPSVPVFSK